jgi:hypothetical protein
MTGEYSFRAARLPNVQLLPPFDEYTMAYRDRTAIVDPAFARRVNAGGGMINAVLVIDGLVAGSWKRTIRGSAVHVAVTPFRELSEREQRGVDRQVTPIREISRTGGSMKVLPLALVLVLILGCTTTAQTTPAVQQAPSQFKNVQVLPKTLTRPELIAIMRTFTRGLGVRCNHCHVVTETTPEEKLDFPSDAKEEKRVARVMIQMTQQINGPWLERVEEAEGHHEEEPAATSTEAAAPAQPRVACWTCHRGKTEPEMPPPPPPPAAPSS